MLCQCVLHPCSLLQAPCFLLLVLLLAPCSLLLLPSKSLPLEPPPISPPSWASSLLPPSPSFILPLSRLAFIWQAWHCQGQHTASKSTLRGYMTSYPKQCDIPMVMSHVMLHDVMSHVHVWYHTVMSHVISHCDREKESEIACYVPLCLLWFHMSQWSQCFSMISHNCYITLWHHTSHYMWWGTTSLDIEKA